VSTGVPRTDVLFDEAYATQIKQEMEDELPIIKGKKIIQPRYFFRNILLNVQNQF
jgi:CDP-glycerol glycerophosphotransferase (TagB/SpsB family)